MARKPQWSPLLLHGVWIFNSLLPKKQVHVHNNTKMYQLVFCTVRYVLRISMAQTDNIFTALSFPNDFHHWKLGRLYRAILFTKLDFFVTFPAPNEEDPPSNAPAHPQKSPASFTSKSLSSQSAVPFHLYQRAQLWFVSTFPCILCFLKNKIQ